MIWESGKLLTAEQTARLARMNGEERDRQVQLIAERLRKHAESGSLSLARYSPAGTYQSTLANWRPELEVPVTFISDDSTKSA